MIGGQEGEASSHASARWAGTARAARREEGRRVVVEPVLGARVEVEVDDREALPCSKASQSSRWS
jgi:hypothetical protein